MKAALVYGPGDVRVEEVEVPSIQSDELLVKVKACGICGTDLHVYRTGKDRLSEPPILLGHEFSGEVVQIGADVQDVGVGDKVVGVGFRSCGVCRWCQRGESSACTAVRSPGAGLDGAFAEYVVVPHTVPGFGLFQIPDGVGWEEAATVEPLSVACFDVNRARVKPNEVVLVLGAGPIGLLILQVCKATGVSKVLVSEPNPHRLAMARKLGADGVFDPKQVDLVEAVAEATSGAMANVVFECAGSPAVFQQIPQVLRPFGRLIQVALHEKGLELGAEFMAELFQYRNVTWQGCGMQRWDMAMDLLQKGGVNTRDLITHTFSLDGAKAAFDTQATSPEAIKVVVRP